MHLIEQALTAGPDAALLLTAIGAIAIAIEFLRPGLVLPGVFGSVLLFLGVVSLTRVTWPAISLIFVIGGASLTCLEMRLIFRIAACACVITGLLWSPAIHILPAACAGIALWGIAGVLIPIARRARANKRLDVRGSADSVG